MTFRVQNKEVISKEAKIPENLEQSTAEKQTFRKMPDPAELEERARLDAIEEQKREERMEVKRRQDKELKLLR